MNSRHVVATALLVAATVAGAASVWERSPWDNSPAEVKKEQAEPTAVRQTGEAKPTNPDFFIDPRDNQPYKTITVNGKTWMAENLNYESAQSSCFNKKPHCKKDGRLYTWHYAVKMCPPGTRLPTADEWAEVIYIDRFAATLTLSGFLSYSSAYYDYGSTGVYWTATPDEDYADYAVYYKWFNGLLNGKWDSQKFYKDQANSVRCIVNSTGKGDSKWQE